MPMHDWTRVEPNYFHDFHVGWIAAFRIALNNGVLPSGYYALAEQVVPPIEPDILTLQDRSSRNGANGSPHAAEPMPSGNGTLALATAPPRVQFTSAERKAKSRTQRQ